MSHDDGKKLDDVSKSDIVLLGVSRTSKTPTSIYLANRGYKTINIPLVMDQKIPEDLKSEKNKMCVIGLIADPERLADIRRNRVAIMRENRIKEYTNLNSIKDEVNQSKQLFKKYNWPIIDVTRKSVEETAASILKIFDIQKTNENNFSIQKRCEKKDLDKNNITAEVIVSGVDEDQTKDSLLAEGATPLIFQKVLLSLNL